jgi:hypothetical protein
MSVNTRSERARGKGKHSRGPIAAEGSARSAKDAIWYGQFVKRASGETLNIVFALRKGR